MWMLMYNIDFKHCGEMVSVKRHIDRHHNLIHLGHIGANDHFQIIVSL